MKAYTDIEQSKKKETAMSFLKSCGIMNANGELADEYKIEQDYNLDYENANIQQKDFAPKSAMEAIKEEKVDNANKVEPKFKVGDWITFYGGAPFKILKVEPEQNGILDYLLLGQNGHDSYYNKKYVDENARLWTIQDAKDGDVVVEKSDGTIGIFQSIGHHPDGGSYNDLSYCFLHCRYDDEFFYADFENGNTMVSDDAIPATKEQRDILFQKMKEAGYEWDAEKKELRKIEQNPAWSEEDESILNGITNYLCSHDSCELEGFGKWYDWLKSLKDRVQPQPKQEWSENNEKMISLLIKIFEVNHPNGYFKVNPIGTTNMEAISTKEIVEWLKSLKPHWKPSEQNIKDLEWCADLVKDKMGVGFHRLQVFIDELKQL